MKQAVEAGNPYDADRYGFAWQNVPTGTAAHLDMGCDEGQFLASLAPKSPGDLVGTDVSAEAVGRGLALPTDADLVTIDPGDPLPFADDRFTSATMLDVLEHIDDQPQVLNELRRVLVPGATLIITVPKRHALSVFDVDNLKFRFPKLHRRYVERRHGVDHYAARYGDDVMVGNVSADKAWHEHFTEDGLRRLLDDAGFSVTTFDGAGFFARPIALAAIVLDRLGVPTEAIRRVEKLDNRRFSSAHLFCVARARD